MPSKYGFGNTRKKSPMPMYGKSQKNPVKLTEGAKDKIMASDANPNFKKAIANSPIEKYGKKGSMAKMYGKKSAMKNYKKGYYGA